MFKKFYLFLTLLTAFLWLGSGSAWGDPISIDPENPYFTGFEDDALNALPSGWTTSSNGTSYVDNKNNISVKAGSKALYVGANRGKTFVLIFPEFSDDIQYLSLSFYQRKGSKNATYRLGYYSSGTFTSLKSFNTSGSTTYSEVTQDYSGAPSGALMAIQINSTETSGSSKSTLYIDNVTVTTSKPAGGGDESSCANPTLGTPTILPDGVTVTWTAGGEETAYQYACVAKNATPESWTNVPGTELTLTLHGLTAGTSYDLYVRSDCGEEQSSGAKVNFTPTCPAPTAPQIANPGTTTADLSWTAAAGITTYQYVAAISGQTPDWSNAQSVTDATSVQLTDLQPGKTYKAYVRSYFSATSISSAVETSAFQTECGAEDLPFNEYFSAANPCWKLEHCHGSTGVNSGRFRFYYTSSYPQYLISPELTTSANQVQVEFEYQNSSNTYPETFKVGYSTTTKDVANFTWGDEVTANDNSKAYTYSDVLPAGVKYIAIQCTSNNAYYLYIDNFSVTEYVAPACAAPTALAVSEIGTNSAKVTWNSEATDFALEYKKTSDANWTAATGTIASPFVLSGLAANETEYTVRVQAICGGTPSEWVVLANPFKTECVTPTVTELAAWEENFESQTSGEKPACWSEVSSYAISAYTQVNASAAKDGSLGVQVYVYGTNTEIALLPTFTEEIKNLKISFDYKNYGTGSKYAALEVGYYSGSTFTNVTTLAKTTTFAASGEIEMPKTAPDGARIAFRVVGAYSNYNGSAYIDNISVIRKPTCAVPTITAANATSDGAVVTWTAGDDEGQWNLQYREIAEPENSWNLVEDVTTGYEITGLEIGHNYEVQVQAYCDATHQSAWTASANFSPICGAAPSNLTVSARTTNSATLTWEGAENAFKLQTSQDNSTWSDAIDVNAKTYNLSGLSAGQTYYVRVQNACGGTYASTSFKTWCGLADAAELPLNIESFTAVPECWEINFVGEYSGISNNKIYFYGNAEQMAVLPAYNIELNKLSVTFGYSTSASLEFGYLDEPNGAFHAFASQPASGEELNLENEAAAVKYIAVRYTSTSAYASGSITSVQLRKTPTCAKPTAVAGTPGVGSASISWTENGSAEAWNLQYKTGSADWTTVAVTENPYALNGLEQGVSYKVRVQANCGEELSDWSDEASFITDCEGIAALPWYADFSQNLSACWTIYAQDETYYKPVANTTMNELKLDGGKNGSSNNVVVLPAFSASLTNAVMSFEYYGSTGANYAQLEAGYMTNKDDASTFTALQTLAQAGSYTEARVALATVPAGKYLAFRVAGASSQTDMRVKNLRVINAYNFADNVDNSGTLAALNGQTVDVTIERTLVAADYYNTICLPFDVPTLTGTPLEGGDLWAFKYAKVENEELLFRIIEADHIEAGVPYLIAFPNNPENIVNPLFKNVTIAASAGQAVGDASVAQFVGILKPETFEPGIKGKLFLYENNTLYWWDGDAASDLKSFRAYFNVNTNSGANYAPRHGMKARIIKSEQSATDVDNIYNNDVQSIKLLENNQVVIIRNGVKYNVQGQVIR